MGKRKQYPLKMERMVGDDEPLYMTRGHHDRGTFADAVRVETGYRPDVALVQQLWWRAVPDNTGDLKYRCVEADRGRRGAFPVTVYQEL